MGRRHTALLSIGLVFTVFLAACAPVPTPTPTPSPPTATPTSVPKPTPTPRPTPTPCPGSCLMDSPREVAGEPMAATVARTAIYTEIRCCGYTAFLGSGVIISAPVDSSTALVVVAYHGVTPTVIADFEQQVTDLGGNLYEHSRFWVTADTGGTIGHFEADVVGYNRDYDIALLSICCSFAFEAAELADAGSPEWTAAFYIGYGRSGGLETASVTSGRVVDGPFGEYLGFDAGAVPGDSGSAVYDSVTGEMLGILNRGLVDRSEMSSLLASSVPWPDGSAVGVTAAIISQELLEE